MKITNDGNLPEPLYQAIIAQQQQHSVGEADISCTGLIDAPLIAWLWRNYGIRSLKMLLIACGHCMAR